jgi:membrane protease YdiL (CAAX protease family)
VGASEVTEVNPSKSDRIELLKLAGVTIAWFLLTRYLVPIGDRIVPAGWKVAISFQTFQMICQAITLAVGLLLSFTVLRRPRVALGMAAPKGAHVTGALLLAPAAFASSAYFALQIAMPRLIAEIAFQGPGASRQNAGELGRTITQEPLLLVLLWGAALAAIGEELLFRGALWSAVKDLVSAGIGLARPARPSAQDPRAAQGDAEGLDPDAEPPPFIEKSPLAAAFTRDMVAGLAATITSAIVFGQMHAGMPGGLGLVRVASTTLLGLVCGLGRQVSGTIWVPILLHVVNNTMTIASSRKWFASSGKPVRPIVEGLPDPVVIAAAVGLVASALLLAALHLRRKPAPAAEDPQG